MKTMSSCSLFSLLLLLFVIVSTNGAERAKRRVHIPDELDDVIDDEEDEAWKQWGEKSKLQEDSEPPPFDLFETDPSAFEAEMMERHTGPSMGFIKLSPSTRRSADLVTEIAMKWTKVLKTGSISAKFMGFDLNTVMFTMENGQDTTELKQFVLSQSEAYEIKIGDHIFRRPGDPPLDEVIQMLHREHKDDEQSSKEEPDHVKDEL